MWLSIAPAHAEPIPTPSPTPTSSSVVSSAQSTTDPVSAALGAANLSLVVATLIVALIGIVTAVLTIAGFRGLSDVRRVRDQLKLEVQSVQSLRASLDARLGAIDRQLEAVVQASYHFNEGQNYYQADDFEKAIAWFEAALKAQPTNPRILNRIARCYTNLDNNSASEHYVDQSLKIDPTQAEPYRCRAINLRYVDLDAAIQVAKKATELEPLDRESWNYLGILQREAGKFEDAKFSHRQALAITPIDPITHFFIFLLLWRQGHRQEAGWKLAEMMSALKHAASVERIKPLWENCLTWAHTYATSDDDLVDRTKQLLQLSEQPRTRKAVLGHILFLCAGDARKLPRNMSWATACLNEAELKSYMEESPQ